MRRNIGSVMPLNRLLSGRGRSLRMVMVGVSLSLVLTGCFDRPSPDLDWYLEIRPIGPEPSGSAATAPSDLPSRPVPMPGPHI